jgi:hypothetical protein
MENVKTIDLSLFDQLYNQVKQIFGNGTLSTSQLLILTPRIIQVVQQVGTLNALSGQEKKLLFFQVVNKIVDESGLSDEDKKNLHVFVDAYLPLIVDAVVFAYKSDAFDKIKAQTKKCFASCRGL